MSVRAKTIEETMAYKVRELSDGAVATSYESNYCVKPDGSRVLFADHGIPAPKTINRTNDAEGRCKRYIGQYADNSILTMVWSAWGQCTVAVKR